MGEQNHANLLKVLALAGLLQVGGTLGLSAFEGIGIWEAAYQTLLILLAHFDHYGFHNPVSRIIVIFLIISSLVVIVYLLKWFAEYMITIGDSVKKRRVRAKIEKLKNHYIVCGLGRVGHQVVQELAHEKVPFVGLDKDQAKVDEAIKEGYIALNADSTDEDTLSAAGIERASGIVVCLGEDSQNLLVTLAARALNPKVFIVARVNRGDNEKKLKSAGADRVVHPYKIGGYHMANTVMRPGVVDYMDIVTNSNGSTDLEVEEMVVAEDSKLAGHQLGSKFVDGSMGATVIAINGNDGTSHIKPSGHETVYPGDRLILLGARKDLSSAADLIR
jgi:voltage-gated potassium channel